MNETLQKRPSGISANALRVWGLLFLVVGVAGRSLIENRILGVDHLNSEQLLALMNQHPEAMTAATVALVCKAIYTCAAPIFAFLLVEGFRHTENLTGYITRMGILAAVTEIPYDLAFSGKLINMGEQNPVFALLVGLIVLWLYRSYREKSAAAIAVKAVVTVSAFLWVGILRIDQGHSLILLIMVLWLFQNKQLYRIVGGVTTAFLCSIFSPFYMASPMSFVAIYLYNGEKGAENRIFNYVIFPVVLLAFFSMGLLIFPK